MARQTQGKETQGDYRPLKDIENTKQRLKENMTKPEFKILEKYEIELVKKVFADISRRKNFAIILPYSLNYFIIVSRIFNTNN